MIELNSGWVLTIAGEVGEMVSAGGRACRMDTRLDGRRLTFLRTPALFLVAGVVLTTAVIC